MAALIGVSVKPAGGTYTVKLPLDALEQDGVPPEQGDSVSFSVEGSVQSVSGTNAVVKVESVNGEPVNESPADEAAEGEPPDSGAGPSTSDMGAALAKGAKGQPMPF